ncbi:unnamed protein product [Paramecium sonneborni]|uniref:Uncharacterized protein n=1 Tax=Paramecium sonneborni TaxID=65129 RepID=A0A8S1KSQ3_9CILI|nr:unnamed protein product [Paramecium sonneborni]
MGEGCKFFQIQKVQQGSLCSCNMSMIQIIFLYHVQLDLLVRKQQVDLILAQKIINLVKLNLRSTYSDGKVTDFKKKDCQIYNKGFSIITTRQELIDQQIFYYKQLFISIKNYINEKNSYDKINILIYIIIFQQQIINEKNSYDKINILQQIIIFFTIKFYKYKKYSILKSYNNQL